ncbi:MAG TPA: hypothetical protein VHH92_07755, partial [Actinomycetota bacterium]|nr:hypothetical protein [Actinomycetota bacterium]
MPPRLSIVIALHDDASPETILGLADQTLDPREIELVVVDGWHHEPSWHAAGRAAEKVRDRLAVRLLRV